MKYSESAFPDGFTRNGTSRRGSLPLWLAAILVAAPISRSPAVSASDVTRIFVMDSASWSVAGKLADIEIAGSGAPQGSHKPQRAEVMKTIAKRSECRGMVVTINRMKADYLLLIERVHDRTVLLKDSKMALFNKEGDMVASSSTRSVGAAVRGACTAIQGR